MEIGEILKYSFGPMTSMKFEIFQDCLKEIPCFVDNFKVKDHHGAACWVAGWGATRYGGRDSQSLLSIGLNLMDVDYCKMHSFYDSHILQTDELCAGLPPTEESSFNSYDEQVITGEKDSCQGDSGGPLICDIEGTAALVGVVSWGSKCAHEGYPGIYSNAHRFREWIESVTMCGDIECFNDGYCEFDKSESKGFCVCPRPWNGEKCEDADSSLCWDEYEEKITSGLTSVEREEFQSLDEAKKKCDELGASDCNSIIYTNQGQLSLGS